MRGTEIALFPLKTVLFPGGPLPLRIFETRYIDMVSRCLKNNESFGVIAIRRGTEVGEVDTFEIGTAAEIVSWHQDEQGLLGISAIGRRRFRLKSSERQQDGLYVGQVQWLAPDTRLELPDRYRPAASFLQSLLQRLGSLYGNIDSELGDAAWVGCRLAEILPLSVSVKQQLLEMDDSVDRLDALLPMIERFRSKED